MVRRWKPLQDSDLKRKRHSGSIRLTARFFRSGRQGPDNGLEHHPLHQQRQHDRR
jgi:hypothetical protein